MSCARGPLSPRPPLLLLVLLLVVLLAVPASAEALLASSRRGGGLRLTGASPAETLSGVTQPRCQLACHQHTGCRSFNFHADSGACEVFGVTACDSTSYVVQPADGWSWFDVVPDLMAEPNQTLWDWQACTRDGRCRDSCLRQLGQGCRHNQQCTLHISGKVGCYDNVCKCNPNSWQYNETLCHKKNQDILTDGQHWVWKKMLNDICSTEVKVKCAGSVEIGVFQAYTHYTKRYVFKISQTDIKAYRYVDGAATKLLDRENRAVLSGNRFTQINLKWCNGNVRLSTESGRTNYISWNDPHPLSPSYLAMVSSPNTEGHWRLAENVVDPWFGDDWSPSRVYSLPRDTWMARRRTEQDFWVEFECRITRDCNWLARQQNTWHNANIWKVIIGGWDNTQSAIYRHVTDGSWHYHSYTPTPAILSATEFRRFRIHFTPAKISVYRADEPEPFMTHDVGAPFTINFDGPEMCCNVENVEYRLVQYDEGWGYEGGFRWGENLLTDGE